MGFYIVNGGCIGIGVQLEIKGTIYGISIHSNCSDNLQIMNISRIKRDLEELNPDCTVLVLGGHNKVVTEVIPNYILNNNPDRYEIIDYTWKSMWCKYNEL